MIKKIMPHLPEKIISDAQILESGSQTMMHTGENDAKIKTRLSKSSPLDVKMLVEFIRRGISVILCKKNLPRIIVRVNDQPI